jgi:hypothetical protein
VILHHSNRPPANLSRKFVRRLLRVHSPILSRVGASGKPGAVQSVPRHRQRHFLQSKMLNF